MGTMGDPLIVEGAKCLMERLNLVKESDENNNQLRLIVHVEGACEEILELPPVMTPIRTGQPSLRR